MDIVAEPINRLFHDLMTTLNDERHVDYRATQTPGDMGRGLANFGGVNVSRWPVYGRHGRMLLSQTLSSRTY
jgi:hypothetical protein